ncbi:hypothetical protein S7711_04863 [Stachybotrys chartarum IBT 7711]|uniref:Choline kinase N-terminal domain-containing protein n=1 Tax=Stachybotrys chartarum (strain CBS 109288 / IBT 7711) TaxID=1280523 RepID=A0A084B6D2_STACB|nr:hypothetical protein S7711_04863 [Stachybotrys chartarum IBT 7711]KFA72187.1 hypothetical protein S40288_06037 [Stachybotrys chartarum IBT 40288]
MVWIWAHMIFSAAVQIAEPSTTESPVDHEVSPVKQFRASTARRLSGKSSSFQHAASSSKSSLSDFSPAMRPVDDSAHSSRHGHHGHHHKYFSEKLLAQVGEWLDREKKKKEAAKATRKRSHRRKSRSPPQDQPESHEGSSNARPRADSMDSESSEVSLERLERILAESMSSFGINSIPRYSPGAAFSKAPRRNSRATLQRTASSDTDYFEGDVIVPSCDAILDNTKTLSYKGGSASSEDLLSSKSDKEREAWADFKNEILRIAHTLRLKGWRRIPLGSGESISVERLSGAMTNAVYVVTPPAELPQSESKKVPKKVLLRVYGPQVEHLIDRDNELQVLQRLARKKIGPRLLGTFQNGRFEQFFNAITLTANDIREPETSRQIAKRMRELHDGVEVLEHERDAGPGVWRNWDQWQEKVASILTFLDSRLDNSRDTLPKSKQPAWMANGYVCGAPWELFRDTVAKYRDYLVRGYKSESNINDRLVFAHNDTQYGNILRIRPDDEKSPLLQPANKHKQLVVIDFEYAAANLPGLEFANHFTEWSYNYRDEAAPHACNPRGYPTLDEQRRFIKAYIEHKPQFPHGASTPRLTPLDSDPSLTPSLGPVASSSSIVDFMLDARVPSGGWNAADHAREEAVDTRVKELLDEARLWRPANSAQWVAWGVVQAKVPELAGNKGNDADSDDAKEEEDEFDYLSYAQDRSYFFWGDCVQMGLVKLEELPESLQSRLKIVKY